MSKVRYVKAEPAADFFLYRCCGCGAMQAKDRWGGDLLACCEDNGSVDVLPVVEFRDGAWTGWLSMDALGRGLK